MIDWKLKIASFLKRPPWYCLYPDISWPDEVITLLTNRGIKISSPDVEKIVAVANGLNIPPFINSLNKDCFRMKPTVLHPLSAQPLHLAIQPPPYKDLISGVCDTICEISRQYESDEQFFLALWRTLKESLANSNIGGLGNCWLNLPADPRVPYLTTWDAAASASAIAGTWPKPAILIFTIASAQEMISTARRTQDAWMGSYLLSYLIWNAIKKVVDICGTDTVVTPGLNGQPFVDLWLKTDKKLNIEEPAKTMLEIGNLPNVFTAIVPADEAEKLAGNAVKAVRGKWTEICKQVKKDLQVTVKEAWNSDSNPVELCKDDYWKKIWERQQEAFIDGAGIFWVAIPLSNGPSGLPDKMKDFIPPALINYYNRIFEQMKEKEFDLNIGMSYPLSASLAGRALSSRKNLREFKQIREPGHKCTLCGKWEALHPDYIVIKDVKDVSDKIRNDNTKTHPEKAENALVWLGAFWGALADIGRKNNTLKLKGRIRKGEKLCAPCFTRRLALESYFKRYEIDHHFFPSTAGVATASFRGRLLDMMVNANPGSDLAIAFNKYTEKLSNAIQKNNLPWPAAFPENLANKANIVGNGEKFLNIDGSWLFEDYTQAIDDLGFVDTSEAEECAAATGELLQQAKKCKAGTPTPYYAVLAMDGDKMGDWITGIEAPDYSWIAHPDVRDIVAEEIPRGFPRPSGPALQLAMSECLKNFALFVARDIVETRHPGKLVYAGGEDLLAFAPIDCLFSLVGDLYGSFRGSEGGYTRKNRGNELLRVLGNARQELGGRRHEGMTASIGIVVAHHSLPLDVAMAQAQVTLKTVAKKKMDRDALAFKIMKRSGEITEVGFKFNTARGQGTGELLKQVEKVYNIIKDDKLSGRIANKMHEQRIWAESSIKHRLTPYWLKRARENELKRLVRQHALPGHETYVGETLQCLFDMLADDTGGVGSDPWQHFSDAILVLRFLAGKEV